MFRCIKVNSSTKEYFPKDFFNFLNSQNSVQNKNLCSIPPNPCPEIYRSHKQPFSSRPSLNNPSQESATFTTLESTHALLQIKNINANEEKGDDQIIYSQIRNKRKSKTL